METLHTREQRVGHFKAKLNSLTSLLPDGVVFSDTCFDLSSGVLADIDDDYGENARQKELKYHAASHSLDVARRSLMLLRKLDENILGLVEAEDYELAVLASCYHDRHQLEQAVGVNEVKSKEELTSVMFDANYSWSQIDRAGEAITATTVVRGEDGEVTQSMLRKTSPNNILNFVLAMADINGIAMEGSSRMIEDATNLYVEFSGDTELKDVGAFARFLSSQGKFLRDRLDSLDEDIEYYFVEQDRARVMETMQEVFVPSRRALDFAAWMEDPLHLDQLQAYVRDCRDAGIAKFIDIRDVGKKLVDRLTQKLQD